jgi:hypothetical protein
MRGRGKKGRNVGKLAQQRSWTAGSPEIFRWATLNGPIAMRRKILRPVFSAPFFPAPSRFVDEASAETAGRDGQNAIRERDRQNAND